MKKRLFDREAWRHKSFRDMQGWAQLLDIHMYFELAELIGCDREDRAGRPGEEIENLGWGILTFAYELQS